MVLVSYLYNNSRISETDYHDYWWGGGWEKVWLKPDITNGHFMWRLAHIFWEQLQS